MRRLAVVQPSERLPSRIRRGSVAEPDGSKEPVPYNGMRSGPNLPRVDAGLGQCSQTLLPRGFLYGFPQSTCMRQGLWGYSSTIVRILQWGGGGVLPGRMVLLWPAPSFSGGSGLACAVVPPAPPSDVFRNRGTRCTPGGGCAPCTPRGVGRELALAHRDASQPAPVVGGRDGSLSRWRGLGWGRRRGLGACSEIP